MIECRHQTSRLKIRTNSLIELTDCVICIVAVTRITLLTSAPRSYPSLKRVGIFCRQCDSDLAAIYCLYVNRKLSKRFSVASQQQFPRSGHFPFEDTTGNL